MNNAFWVQVKQHLLRSLRKRIAAHLHVSLPVRASAVVIVFAATNRDGNAPRPPLLAAQSGRGDIVLARALLGANSHDTGLRKSSLIRVCRPFFACYWQVTRAVTHALVPTLTLALTHSEDQVGGWLCPPTAHSFAWHLAANGYRSPGVEVATTAPIRRYDASEPNPPLHPSLASLLWLVQRCSKCLYSPVAQFYLNYYSTYYSVKLQ